MTTDDLYAHDQCELNADKLRRYILPIMQEQPVERVLDAGCGVGVMVNALREDGIQAFGVDLAGVEKYWLKNQYDRSWFNIVEPDSFVLPFPDDHFDFIFSIGVIEHVGTTDGHSNRHDNYHDMRQQWLLELFRVLKPVGRLLLGGPNKQFPIDTCHGLDSRASSLEKTLSKLFKTSVHKTWGHNFLWTYGDIDRYLASHDAHVKARSIDGLMNFSRVPNFLRSVAKLYVKAIPQSLLHTGLNPWVMADITKLSARKIKTCDHQSWKSLKRDVNEDVARYKQFSQVYKTKRSPFREFLSAMLIPQVQCVVLHRIAHFFFANRWFFIASAIRRINSFIYRLHIYEHSCIGGGLYIPHPPAVILQGSAGRNLTMFAGSCCFNNSSCDIGNNVSVGAVSVVHNSSIGDDVKISFGVNLSEQQIASEKIILKRTRARLKKTKKISFEEESS